MENKEKAKLKDLARIGEAIFEAVDGLELSDLILLNLSLANAHRILGNMEINDTRAAALLERLKADIEALAAPARYRLNVVAADAITNRDHETFIQ